MTETKDLADREKEAWLGLVALVQLLPGVLDAQLNRDSALTHFEFFALSRLSEAPGALMRMTALAAATNASLSRLSHVVTRLEARGLLRRQPCAEDGRATNVVLTDQGAAYVGDAAPGHLATVRSTVMDALTPEQVSQLAEIAVAVVGAIDPTHRASDVCESIVAAQRNAEAHHQH
ncbi:MarR family winged helix-turn-helix transcriptional regulator [Leifsonia poae]|uniref:MarR family winged helix-turn-helix transcriptional regulator n=1 Tax=Leifsonia poae TaxID=110933 RepID=UPI001CBB843E|nr:MarR family transcriptional regulator [Leifsonia poae]